MTAPTRKRFSTFASTVLAALVLCLAAFGARAQQLPPVIGAGAQSAGIEIEYVCDVESRWNDRGSNADRDVALYEPRVPRGFSMIGGYAQGNFRRPEGCVAVARARGPGLLAPPAGWRIIWADNGSGADLDGSIWEGRPPNQDFVCVGAVGQLGYSPPNPSDYACVHRCLTKRVAPGRSMWTDQGSGADAPVAIYALPHSHSFYAVPDRDPPRDLYELDPQAVCVVGGAVAPAPAPVPVPVPALGWRLHGALVNGAVTTRLDSGLLTVERQGQVIAPRIEMDFQLGDTVTTSSRTEAVLAYGTRGSEAILRPGTKVRIGSLRIEIGEIFAKVVDYFKVDTEYVQATPLGTEFLVRVSRAGVAEITVVEGQVRLESQTPGGWPADTVNPQERATASGPQAPRKQMLDSDEFNRNLEWVNAVESKIRPRAARLLVPALIGLSRAAAEGALREAGLGIGRIQTRATGRASGTVLDQNPRAGSRVAPGTEVMFTVEAESVARAASVSLKESLTINYNRATEVAFSPDGTRIAAGSWSNEVILWDARTGEQRLAIDHTPHGDLVLAVAFSPDGKRIVTGSRDYETRKRTVKVWDVRTGVEALALQSPPPNFCGSVAFSPDGRWIAAGCWDGRDAVATFRLWDAGTGAVKFTKEGLSGAVAFSPDSTRVTGSFGYGTKVYLLDTRTGEEQLSFDLGGSPNSVAFSPDGNRIAAGATNGKLKVWDTRTGKEQLSLEADNRVSVAFGPKGDWIVSGTSTDGTANKRPEEVALTLWDAHTGDKLDSIQRDVLCPATRDCYIESVAVSPDGSRIVSSIQGTTRSIKLWDVRPR